MNAKKFNALMKRIKDRLENDLPEPIIRQPYTAYFDGVSVTVYASSLKEATRKAKARFKVMRVGSPQARFIINEGKV